MSFCQGFLPTRNFIQQRKKLRFKGNSLLLKGVGTKFGGFLTKKLRFLNKFEEKTFSKFCNK